MATQNLERPAPIVPALRNADLQQVLTVAQVQGLVQNALAWCDFGEALSEEVATDVCHEVARQIDIQLAIEVR